MAESAQTKTVFLIRHAESDENRRLASFSRCFKKLGNFSLPSRSDLVASTELLNVPAQLDSGVSEIGAKQITSMGKTLQESNFLTAENIQLVAHSPLLRAQETSEGLLGCRADVKKADSVNRVLELDLLTEKKFPQEWTGMHFKDFLKRISDFEVWLDEQPEDNIAIVGHSQYFKQMLGLDFKFGNCAVWKVTFDLTKRQKEKLENEATGDISDAKNSYNSVLPPQWQDLEVLYECEVKSSSEQE